VVVRKVVAHTLRRGAERRAGRFDVESIFGRGQACKPFAHVSKGFVEEMLVVIEWHSAMVTAGPHGAQSSERSADRLLAFPPRGALGFGLHEEVRVAPIV